jgi:hypothetical protein
MKYKVIRKCHGFMDRLWEKGEIVDSNDFGNRWPEDEKEIPHHFEPIDKPVETVPEQVNDRMSMTDVARQQFNRPETATNSRPKTVKKESKK